MLLKRGGAFLHCCLWKASGCGSGWTAGTAQEKLELLQLETGKKSGLAVLSLRSGERRLRALPPRSSRRRPQWLCLGGSCCPLASPSPGPGGCRRSKRERRATSASRCRAAAKCPRCRHAGSAAAGQRRWGPPWGAAAGPELVVALEEPERIPGAASSVCSWETARWARPAWW